MPIADTTIRAMTRSELDLAVQWAADEGWNPGLHDADAFFTADPEGFLIEWLGDEPVAVISAVRYGERFGFIGFYIVKPGFRGQGLGLKIWQAAMARLAGRNIGLDGVVDQQPNYRKSGFRLAWNNARFQGVGGGAALADPDVHGLGDGDLAAVLAYDRPFFPDDRSAFLRAWLAMPGAVSLGIWQGGKLAGYGVLRSCRTGYKIGPLIADTPTLAARLFAVLQAGAAQGAPLFLDVPMNNPDAVALAQQHEMRVVFETARMYTLETPAMPQERLFGVTSFELG